MSELTVLVAGTGLGGLSLAQSLRGHGIDVTLFERDTGPWDRTQGYRLHLDADARNAAREVMSDELWAVFQATSHVTGPDTTILGTDLSVIKPIPTDDALDDQIWPGHDPVTGHANVDRATLRQILLSGLDDVIHYGRTLERYEETADGVTAHFADGTSAHGDVLVGADGIRSAVRRRRDRRRGRKAVARGRVGLPDALADYEREMLRYGFEVVAAAAETGRQRMAQNPLPG